jgi:Uma2 family endonuclease
MAVMTTFRGEEAPGRDELLERVLASPRLGLLLREIEGVLAAEQARRAEFYDNFQEGEKAEFVNGEVILHSPVSLEHNLAGKRLLKLLDTYVARHGLGIVGYEKLMISLTRNDYEPDLCFFRAARAAEFTAQQRRFPAPDFVAEILSPSTETVDRGVKFEDYAAHGVEEYWLVDPGQGIVEQYLLQGGEYELVFKADSGLLRARAVSGFAIPVASLFEDSVNLAALAAILAG